MKNSKYMSNNKIIKQKKIMLPITIKTVPIPDEEKKLT